MRKSVAKTSFVGTNVSCFFVIAAVTLLFGAGEANTYAQAERPVYTSSELTHAVAVQSVNQDALLSHQGVLGVGVGLTNGTLGITVLVDNASRTNEVPTSLDDLPVTVTAVGTIHPVDCGGSNPQLFYPLPVPLGVSGGNAIIASSNCFGGTIGFKVRDNASGNIGWISNSHVLSTGTNGCPGSAPIGTPEYQPGSIDNSCLPAQPIGVLTRVVPITFAGDDLVDCGFVSSSDAQVSSDILNLGPQVNNVAQAFVGQVVRKNGRTSSCTEGTVVAVNLTIAVDYSDIAPCGTAVFTNQIMYSPALSSPVMSVPGDSGSPVVDANNNAVALNFAGDTTGDGFGNPIQAVLDALSVSLSSGLSSQVVTRTSRYWFTHGFSSDTNCATLLSAINANGGIIDLGFVALATQNRNSDNVIDGTDAFIEALSFYWLSNGRTGEPTGTQSAKLGGSSLCKARKQLAVELIAAIANTTYLGTWPPNATYTAGHTVTNFPADLISQARTAAAGFDIPTIQSMTLLLKEFNSSGVTNNLPNGLQECSAQTSKTLKPIARDPMTQATCPGNNNSCVSAQTVAFPSTAGSFTSAVFTRTVAINAFTNSFPSPACGSGGRDAAWQIPPTMGLLNRSFTVSTSQANFDTMISVWSGDCSNLVPVACANNVLGVEGETLNFETDGVNTFFIVVEGPDGQYGKFNLKITSP